MSIIWVKIISLRIYCLKKNNVKKAYSDVLWLWMVQIRLRDCMENIVIVGCWFLHDIKYGILIEIII